MKTVEVTCRCNFSFKVDDNLSNEEIDNEISNKIKLWDCIFEEITAEVVDHED